MRYTAHLDPHHHTIPAIAYVRLADEAGTMSYVGPQARALLGHEAGDLLVDRRRLLSLVHPDDLSCVLAEEARVAATGEPFHVEYRVRAGDGRFVWMRDEAAPVRDGDGTVRAWHGVLVDVSAQKAHQAALVHRALHDPLTGLPNRTLFISRLSRELVRANQTGTVIAVLAFDVDGLRSVNDRFGHAGGDRVLVGVGERLRAAVVPGGMLARLEDDEFAALIDGGREEAVVRATAEQAAERGAAALWPPFGLVNGEAQVTVSVGIAIGGGADEAEAVLARVESALRRNKRLVDGRYGFFGPASSSGPRPMTELDAAFG